MTRSLAAVTTKHSDPHILPTVAGRATRGQVCRVSVFEANTYTDT